MLGAALVLSLPSVVGAAGSFAPHRYQTADGAITLHAGGDRVDPYFATKALLAADAGGLDITVAASRWISWLLPRQRPSGRFDRYCLANKQWRACADADADDAMSALWIELLYRMAPAGEMPPAWTESAARTESHLADLYQPNTGLYRVFADRPLTLFMDNVEIYGAFARTAKRRAALAPLAAVRLAWSAWRLRRAIETAFWREAEQKYASTTDAGDGSGSAFYPDTVAQLYPLLEGMPTPAGRPEAVFDAWFREHGERWLSFSADPYPWGIAALAASRVGARSAASQWAARAAPLRHSGRWNVLEEAAYQALHGEAVPTTRERRP